MKKVLFVCLGNICRSPMAEFVFKDMVKKDDSGIEFFVDSAATSTEEIGSDTHWGTKKILDEIVIDLLVFREGNFDDNTVIEAAYLFFASLDRNYGNEIDEFFEFRDKKPKPGTSLKDTANLLFAVYEDMCGGELE